MHIISRFLCWMNKVCSNMKTSLSLLPFLKECSLLVTTLSIPISACYYSELRNAITI